jgi:hypothetical protein
VGALRPAAAVCSRGWAAWMSRRATGRLPSLAHGCSSRASPCRAIEGPSGIAPRVRVAGKPSLKVARQISRSRGQLYLALRPARASDVRRTERRLDGVYREFVRRQRPAPLAAKQTSWCRRPFQTGCGRSGRVAQWRLMPKPGLRRPCGRATGVFPKRTVGCVGVSGDGRMTASTSSELNKPTLRGHSLSLFRGEAAGRILQRPRHCLPTARSPLMAGTVNAERRGNQMFVCSGGTRSGSDWAASSPVSITGGCMPSR